MNHLKLDLTKLADVKKGPAVSPVAESTGLKRGLGLTFEDLLESSIKNVNDLQQDSDKMVNRLATGDVDDISEVVLSAQRAEFALRLITEVRNKLVDAYQQLGRMSV
ncbi:MAG: flagellar hook-basal body complex protein FliE [Synergistota bacterium]|nr:flagellar hook-basal body complex protein FliE [Synergistota bacterium]